VYYVLVLFLEFRFNPPSTINLEFFRLLKNNKTFVVITVVGCCIDLLYILYILYIQCTCIYVATYIYVCMYVCMYIYEEYVATYTYM